MTLSACAFVPAVLSLAQRYFTFPFLKPADLTFFVTLIASMAYYGMVSLSSPLD